MRKTKAQRKTDPLPDKPSQILKVALRDLMKVEAMKKTYNINMSIWHSPTDGEICNVCHAGAVMACTLGAEPHQDKDTFFYGDRTRAKLNFIDNVRRGDIVTGLHGLRVYGVVTLEQYDKVENSLMKEGAGYDSGSYSHRTIVPVGASRYEPRSREKYRNYIEGVIGILQSYGL